MFNWLRPIFKPFLILFLKSFFFDKKYLSGRYFEDNYIGFRWAIKSIWQRNVLRLGKSHPWPVGMGCVISDSSNIFFHPDDLHIFQTNGTYFQNFGAAIHIGRGAYIAPNVGIITANHSFDNLDQHDCAGDVVLGKGCWVGMNAVILPGVVLGDKTIVGAGAIVTKSFPQGRCVVAGNPARVIRLLN